MALKTKPAGSVTTELLDGIEPGQKRKDCYEIAGIMAEITGEPAIVWGASIIGFGKYKYTNTSRKEAEWFIVGFSPRIQNIAIYLLSGFSGEMLQKLGKCKTGKSCLYIDKLADVNVGVLKEMIAASVDHMRKNFVS